MIKVVFGGIVAMAALGSTYVVGFRPPADEFALSRAQVYERLAAAPLHAALPHAARDGAFHGLPVNVHGDGLADLRWDSGGQACTLKLTRLAEASTRVAVACTGVDSASAGHLRDRVIELAEATLTGRAFNPQKADGATAYRWPAQPERLARPVKPGASPTSPAGMVTASDIDAGPPEPADPHGE